MTTRARRIAIVGAASMALVPFAPAAAQYSLSWYTIDGGGGSGEGVTFELASSIGQPDAGVLIGGAFELHAGFWSVGGVVVSVPDDGTPSPPPLAFRVQDAAPNPFRSSVRVGYELPEETSVRVEVYDLAGKLVAVPLDEIRGAGTHTVSWDGRDRGGLPVGSGVYVLRLTTASGSRGQKLHVIR